MPEAAPPTVRATRLVNQRPACYGMESGSVVGVRGDVADRRGFRCVQGRAAGEVVASPQRVLAWWLREGPDGWCEATREALDQIAAAFPTGAAACEARVEVAFARRW